jgi:type I restriction enzyme, S subunit
VEVRPTYKETDVGLIPTDWIVRTISQVAPLQRGFDLPTRDITPGSFPVVYSNGVESFHNVAMVEGPGVVTGRSGTLGKVHYVDSDYWPHNTSLWVTRFNDNVPKFVYYLYASLRFERFASGSGVPTLNRNDAHSYRIALPAAREEQCAIATALSDVDALLDGLDQLLAKKRDLKSAAMQQLLTGETRLPGFHGEWGLKSLGTLGAWKGGMTPSMKNPSYWAGGDFPWISSSDVKTSRLVDTSQHVTSWALRRGAAVVVPRNSVVLVTRSGILRKYLPIALVERPMAINQDIKALIPSETVSADFLLHALTGWGDAILAKCLKAGTTVESVEFPWLKAFSIPVPPHDEQLAIADVLSDMDAELAALKAERDKTRYLKQAMMQELLSGKTRLMQRQAVSV